MISLATVPLTQLRQEAVMIRRGQRQLLRYAMRRGQLDTPAVVASLAHSEQSRLLIQDEIDRRVAERAAR